MSQHFPVNAPDPPLHAGQGCCTTRFPQAGVAVQDLKIAFIGWKSAGWRVT
jgi:hypothetical protein